MFAVLCVVLCVLWALRRPCGVPRCWPNAALCHCPCPQDCAYTLSHVSCADPSSSLRVSLSLLRTTRSALRRKVGGTAKSFFKEYVSSAGSNGPLCCWASRRAPRGDCQRLRGCLVACVCCEARHGCKPIHTL